MKNAKGGTKYS